MKKIIIFMKDSNYANSLSKSLNSRYEGLNCEVFDEISDDISNDILILTDKDINKKQWYLDLSKDNNRYKGLDHIFSLINDSFESRFLDRKIITFANMSQRLTNNPGALEMSKELVKKGSTLLINFNNFHNYGFYKNEIGLESLLFLSSEDTMEFNTYEGLNYLNSSYLPLQINKEDNYQKILNEIKNSNFNFILIDLCFSISKRDLDILSISNQIVFYNSQNFDKELLNKTMEMINNDNKITENKLLIQQENKGFRVITNNNIKSIDSIKEVVGLLW